MQPDQDILDFLTACGVRASSLARIDRLARFHQDLLAANRCLNLTRITAPEDFWIKHIADSLAVGQALPELLRERFRVADVGCGPGFPGLPLAWANPRIEVTGIESNGKKAEFASAAAMRLGLPNFASLARQAREAGRLSEHQRRYDVVVLRAVGKLNILIRDCCRLPCRPGGRIVFYLTPQQVKHRGEVAEREAQKCGFSLRESAEFELPRRAGRRQFLILTATPQ